MTSTLKEKCLEHIGNLDPTDAWLFMKGFETLTKSEKTIILYLLELDENTYYGTNVRLAQVLEYKESYNGEISRSLAKLEKKRIISIHPPARWYEKKVILSHNWVSILIKIGEQVA